MIRRITQHIEHHDGVGHCRENRAEAVLAIEPLGDERHRTIDRAPAQRFGKQRLGRAQQRVDTAKEGEPGPLLMRRLPGRSNLARRANERLVDGDAARIFSAGFERLQDEQRHEHCACPIRDLG